MSPFAKGRVRWPVDEHLAFRLQQTSFPLAQGGRAANQYELPLGWNGLLPLVADLCEKLNDVRG